jgi:hypothetical protein
MFELRCRDVGFDCSGVIRGATKDDVLQQAVVRATEVQGTVVTPELATKVMVAILIGTATGTMPRRSEARRPAATMQRAERGQVRVAADQWRAHAQPGQRRRGSRRSGVQVGAVGLDRHAKAVAAPGDGCHDVPAEQRAQAAHEHRQVAFFDHHVRPPQVEHFLLGDEPASAFGQRQQQVEGAAAERGAPASTSSRRSSGRNSQRAKRSARYEGGWVRGEAKLTRRRAEEPQPSAPRNI